MIAKVRWAALAGVVVVLALGCAGAPSFFETRSEQKEAARALAEKEAAEARALEAQQAAAEQAKREAEADAERRKREEGEDLNQERRHRRERKEAEHDAELRELYKGSQAPAPEEIRQLLADYVSAVNEVFHALRKEHQAVYDFLSIVSSSEVEKAAGVTEKEIARKFLSAQKIVLEIEKARRNAIFNFTEAETRIIETNDDIITYLVTGILYETDESKAHDAAMENFEDASAALSAASIESTRDSHPEHREVMEVLLKYHEAIGVLLAATHDFARQTRLIVTPELYHTIRLEIENLDDWVLTVETFAAIQTKYADALHCLNMKRENCSPMEIAMVTSAHNDALDAQEQARKSSAGAILFAASIETSEDDKFNESYEYVDKSYVQLQKDPSPTQLRNLIKAHSLFAAAARAFAAKLRLIVTPEAYHAARQMTQVEYEEARQKAEHYMAAF